ATMHALADLAAPMIASPPAALVGIEPDEIDFASKVVEALAITTFDVDRLAIRFLAVIEPLMTGEGEANLDEIYARGAALSEGVSALKLASQARFDMRQ